MRAIDSVPPAPPMFSRMTGWPSAARIGSASTRPSASTAPPAGSATTIVIGRDGKFSACAPAAPHVIASAAANSILMISSSLRLDARRLDDRPPFLDVGLLLRGKAFRILLLAWRNFHA